MDETIATRLREIVDENGGVSAFAKLIDISQPRLSQYLNGKNDLNTEILSRIAELGFDMNYLIVGNRVRPSKMVRSIVNSIEEENRYTFLVEEYEKVLSENKKLKTQLSNIQKIIVVTDEPQPYSKVADKKETYKGE